MSKRVLSDLQAAIESLHAVETGLEVADYVVSGEQKRDIPGAVDGLPEQFFVREVEDAVEMALYVDPAIVELLAVDPPAKRLHEGNLEAYCIALEGVSHFVLTSYRAARELQVSPLELEIQAEVDKFVTAWVLLTEQGQHEAVAARGLERRLFTGSEVRDEVHPHEVERYEVATKVAQRYCARLARRGAGPSRHHDLRREVRAFFRKGLAEKMRAA